MKLVLVILSLVVILSACTSVSVPPADAGEINTVVFTHDGMAMDGSVITDMSEIKFRNYCGVISGTYTIPPVTIVTGIVTPNVPIEFSIDIPSIDGAYWCALTAYNINNPIDTESPFSSEYTVFKLGNKYYNSATYKNPFGIQTIKK